MRRREKKGSKVKKGKSQEERKRFDKEGFNSKERGENTLRTGKRGFGERKKGGTR